MQETKRRGAVNAFELSIAWSSKTLGASASICPQAYLATYGRYTYHLWSALCNIPIGQRSKP